MCTDATGSSGAGTRPGRIAAVATASPAGGTSGQAVGTATVTVARRRASDIVEGDVIALPDEVFFPVAARVDGRRTWTWRSNPARLQTNTHRWRWVYEVDQLDEDAEDAAGLAASLPFGFRLLRVSDDHPDQGQQYQSLIIAVREYDLVDVQLRTTGHDQHQPPQHTATTTAIGGEPDRPAGTVARFAEYTARDSTVRVFDRSRELGSDDASDMYVLEVLGVSVLVRLRTTRTHPASRPQLYVHIDNETGEPTDMAVEVANGGETHHRI